MSKKRWMLLCFSILAISLSLACGRREDPRLSVLVPEGSTALSHSWIESHYDDVYAVSRVSGADLLISAFASETYDVIVAPVTLGLKMHAEEKPYKMAALITRGNLHIASMRPLEGLQALDGEEIIAFGERQIPDFILSVLLDAVDFETPPHIVYVGSARHAMLELARDDETIVMSAEPFLSFDVLDQDTLHIIDLGEVWKAHTGGNAFPQAAVFIKDDADGDRIADYLSRLEASVGWLLEGDDVAEVIDHLDYPLDVDVLLAAIPRSGFVFERALDIADELQSFFEAVKAFDAALIGDTLPDASFYHAFEDE